MENRQPTTLDLDEMHAQCRKLSAELAARANVKSTSRRAIIGCCENDTCVSMGLVHKRWLERAMVTQPVKWIGQSVTRLEDPPLVTGRGRFVGDISLPHQLHMRVVRSQVAHGTIIAVDTRAAKALPGVVAVWSAADIPDIPPVGFREGRLEKLEPYRQPVLATDRVRYVGDPVAAVFADDPYVAEDAADLVTVDIEELPVILDAEAAPGEFSPGRDTEAAVVHQGYGDIDAAFGDAHELVELTLSVGRHSGVPLETRGAIGRYDAARDMLELHGAAKIPHATRNLLARMLDRAPSAIHLYESHVGGGFGVRGELYPEDVLVCVAAMRLGRPVKWIEDRREHLIGANHSREQTHKVRAAVDRDGRILAIDDEFWHDQGAYLRTHAIRVTMMVCGFIPGPYRMSAYRSVGHVRLTNKTPAATYRAPGRFETTFIRERITSDVGQFQSSRGTISGSPFLRLWAFSSTHRLQPELRKAVSDLWICIWG